MADLFTSEFKRLKARNPAPDLSNVIDLGVKQDGSVSRICLALFCENTYVIVWL